MLLCEEVCSSAFSCMGMDRIFKYIVYSVHFLFCTWLRMTAQCIVLQRSAQVVLLAADAVWLLQCVCLASVLMNKGDISTREFRSCEVKKKSATLLVPFQAVCWDVSFVSVRPVDASGLTTAYPVRSTSPCVSPERERNVCNVHIRGATPDKCLYFFAGQELYMVTVFWTRVFTLGCTFYT